ncbi:MAG: conjugal transfer protein TrbD, partial [Acetobacter sp.]|nr:conjugal transfer protein TrbD [Acetobacter sp.]
IIGVFLWISCLYLLRLMAKSDPKMRQVYLRHIKYAAYYPARSTPFRINQGKPYR